MPSSLIPYSPRKQYYRAGTQFLFLVVLFLLSTPTTWAAPQSLPAAGRLLASTTSVTTHSLPRFEPNLGQVADPEGNLLPQIQYMYQAPGLMMGLTNKGFIYNLYTVEQQEKEPAEGPLAAAITTAGLEEPAAATYHYHRVEVEFLGANPHPEIIAEEKTSHYANYYLGHCPQGITGVYGYQKLIYKNLYPNIDLVLKRQQDAQGQEQLKYDLIVHPGGDLSQVKMQYQGMDGLALEDGRLQVDTRQGTLTESIPASYWKESQAVVEVSYQLQDGVVTFAANEQRPGQTLVVDPSLTWSTYLGGSTYDLGQGVTTDRSGHALVTGYTRSSDFPAQNTLRAPGRYDVFLTQFDSSGSLLWSTFLGGYMPEYYSKVAVDSSGNIFITGRTHSTDFPITSGAHQGSHSGFNDAFLSKFSGTGSLLWSTYLGGSDYEEARDVATDDSGHVFITGRTKSTDFPTTTGAYQGSLGGKEDVFLSKFSGTGHLLWSTYTGGGSDDMGYGIATDSSEHVYITGQTNSTDFPATSGAYQVNIAGEEDAFLSKFTGTGSLLWSTYLGGSGEDLSHDAATDSSGNVLITGNTESTDFPITSGAYQASYLGNGDAYLSKFNSTGNLSRSSYLGGSSNEFAWSIATDGSSSAFVTGYTSSTDFPISGAYQGNHAGGTHDAFLAKFSFGAPEIAVFGAGQEITDGQTTTSSLNHTAFGTLPPCSGTTRSFWIFNPGTETLRITDTAISGSAAFSISGLDTAAIPPADSTRLLVTYHPTQASQDTAIIEITSNHSGDTVFTFTITGAASSLHASIDTALGCGSFTAPSGRYTWTTPGTYTDTLQSAHGCDSILTIHLTGGATALSSPLLTTATITAPNTEIRLVWRQSQNPKVSGYGVYRQGSSEPFHTTSDAKDTTLLIALTEPVPPLCYVVKARDECGNISEPSNVGCIIFPTAKAKEPHHLLTWPPYQEWPGGVSHYAIYRSPDTATWMLLGQVDGETSQFKDEQLDTEAPQFVYQVVAYGQAGSQRVQSASMVVTVTKAPVVWVPNSFSPGQSPTLNDEFGPVASWIKGYEMRIYNRWGELVYQTPNSQSWDGTVDGRMAPAGVYSYTITATGYDEQVRVQGTVTILR